MVKRSYRKYGEVFVDLHEYCKKMVTLRQSLLPEERKLSAELHTSRMTLRKALAQAEEFGVIIRKGRHLEIAPVKTSLSGLGRIIFVAAGNHGTFTLNAFDRLYRIISEKIIPLGADFELFLTNSTTAEEEFSARIKCASIIMVTAFSLSSNSDNVFKILHNAQAQGCRVIALTETLKHLFHSYVALDNYMAGVMAADCLLKSGCQHLAFIGSRGYDYLFQQRLEGFKNTLEQLEVPFYFSTSGLRPAKHFTDQRRKELQEAIQQGANGAFIASDEAIGVVTSDLFAKKLIPGKFKILTLNGNSEALQCNPPISCLSHANVKVANAVVEYLKRLANDPDTPPLRQLIEPEICHCGTL